MPELPEVETIVTNLKSSILNKKIIDVDLRHTDLRTKVSLDITKNLLNKTIISTYRRAKWPAIVLSEGYLWLHLGMTGQILTSSTNMINDPHVHLSLQLNDHTYLIFKDPRKFGTIAYTTDKNPPSQTLGPEPLEPEFNTSVLKNNLKTIKKGIKQALMDSKVVVGIGNIYASEILFHSKIHPEKPANKLSDTEYQTVVTNIKKILTEAIARGGSTLKDYRHPDGSIGNAQLAHAVYNRSGHPCNECGNLILEKKHGGRTTYWCNTCQSNDQHT